jgi:hypothetical protein
MDERPEALLKSALEKIVYFEARSEQLSNELVAARSEADRFKVELGSAAQREIELRRQIAELEVRVNRAHAERDELARTNEALRTERTALIGKLIEASRISESGHQRKGANDEGFDFDLASFISELRGEALRRQTPGSAAAPSATARPIAKAAAMNAVTVSAGPVPAVQAAVMSASAPSTHVAPAAAVASASPAMMSAATASAAMASGPMASAALPAPAPKPVSAPVVAPVPALAVVHAGGRAPSLDGVAAHAARFQAEGRLQISEQQMLELTGAQPLPGRTEETLFSFSVRELSAPTPAARIRAAERLKALGHPAAAPPLAAALNGETEADVQVALLNCFASFAGPEGAAIVAPLLGSAVPQVRISALKALIGLDPTQAGPHLAAAMKDPDRAVRRRASLLALGLSGDAARVLGEEAIRDGDGEVRSLAALVLGASGGERARALLLEALRDKERKVRQAAAQSLSRILGVNLSAVVDMDEPQRRREVRRLATLPVATVPLPTAPRAEAVEPAAPSVDSPELEAVEEVPRPRSIGVDPHLSQEPIAAPTGPSPEMLCASLLTEIRTAIRGRTLNELSVTAQQDTGLIQEACELLAARGQVVRRGTKFFAA